MSISLEALAMMGGDYVKDGISFEEYEKYEEQVPPHLLVDEEDDENIYTKKSYLHFFSSHQEFLRRRENNDELLTPVLHFVSVDRGGKRLEKGKQKKLLIQKHSSFWEVLKKKDLSSFLESNRNNHCIMSS